MATWGDPNSINYRGHEDNPRDPRCRRALRRICGVCKHFEGPDLVEVGVCHKLDGLTPGKARAWDCDHWERRWAHGAADKSPQVAS